MLPPTTPSHDQFDPNNLTDAVQPIHKNLRDTTPSDPCFASIRDRHWSFLLEIKPTASHCGQEGTAHSLNPSQRPFPAKGCPSFLQDLEACPP